MTVTVVPCIPFELLPPENAKPLSPLWLVYTFPSAFTIELTRFEASPFCGLTNSDLLYKVVSDNMPFWANFVEDDRVIEVAVDFDPSLPGKTFPITVQASYSTLVQEMPFAISFIKEEEKVEKPSKPKTEKEPEPEEPG